MSYNNVDVNCNLNLKINSRLSIFFADRYIVIVHFGCVLVPTVITFFNLNFTQTICHVILFENYNTIKSKARTTISITTFKGF